MPRVPLTWPFGGRLDSAAHSQNPELYTRQARNVRGRDPVTGRMRGAMREVMTKWNPSVIGASRIKALCSTAIDDRKVAYSFTGGTESVVWANATPSKSDCLGGKVDAQGNVYALDGNAGIVKYNSRGVEVLKIALPVADSSHIVRALWVDEAGRIFAGVSAGGDVATARVFCVLQLQDSQYFVLWTIEPKAYTEDLRVYRGTQLYAAHNYPLENRARVVIYENIGLDPTEAKRIESVAYPINGMDVLADDGSLYTTSPSVARITTDLGFRLATSPTSSAPIVGWVPTDDSLLKVWAWYDAEGIDEADVEQPGAVVSLDDGQQVLRWRDKSGHNRHFYSGALALTGEHGPIYRKAGIGGRPCLYFRNSSASDLQSMVTLPNPSTVLDLADQQRSALPGYVGSQFCLFMVIRPVRDATAPRVVLASDNEAAGPATDHVLFVNRDSSTAALPGALTSGFISHSTATDATGDGGQGAAGPPPQSLGFDFASYGSPRAGGAIIVTVLWDGGIQPNDTTKTRCIVRYNGRPTDRFEGLPFETTQPTWLGLAPASIFATGVALASRFQGEIAEILVLDRRSRVDNTEPKVLTYDTLEVGSASAAQTDTQMARIEAYLAYKWGIGYVLPDNFTAEARGTWHHYYGLRSTPIGPDDIFVGGPPAPAVGGRSTAFENVLSIFALVAKHDSQGVLKWVANWATHPGTGVKHGGFGYGVVARKVGSVVAVYSVGQQEVNAQSGIAASTVAVRKVIDLGATFDGTSGGGAWDHSFTSNRNPDYVYPRMAADAFGNLYLPYFETGAAAEWSLLAFKKDPDGSGLAQVLVDFLLSASQQAHAVAIPPDVLNPDYRTDLAVKMAEHVYIFTRNESVAANATVHKLNLVKTNALASGTPRSVHTIAVTEDDIRLVTDASNSIPTGGSGVINATSQYVQALRAGDDIVVLDGIKYWAYKIRDGTVEELVSTSAGEIPPRGKLAMYWRHRLMFGNFADAAGGYAASRLGNIRDWNQNPGSLPTGEQIHTSTQAFSGSATRAGEAEDSITALIPVWDDLAFIGCESRILRLTGDPQDGGNIHKITDSMGIAFGDAWCKDQSGRVFVFGNAPPGLYMLMPEGDPIPLSRHTLEESEFSEINFATHRIVLGWDPIERGVHIWQVAWGSSIIVDHWFWEEKTHRLVKAPPLWTDRYGLAGLQPTAYTYLGGDDTRGLLVGCDDGFIRMLDTGDSDDGTLVDSLVTIGPITPPGGPERDWRLVDVEIALADDQGGCRLEAFASNTSDSMGAIKWARDLKPGMNFCRVRIKGAWIYLRLRGVGLKRWSFESGRCTLVPTSRTIEAGELG